MGQTIKPGVSEFTAFNRRTAKNTKALLSSGFLDTFTPNRFEAVKDLDLPGLEGVLIKYADIFLKGFKDELETKNITAGGGLVDSITFEIERFNNGTNYEIRFPMSPYHAYVDEGVQGVNLNESINKTSPFKFRFKYPSIKHVEALERWIKEKNLVSSIVVPKGLVSEESKAKSFAYAIGLKTKKQGMKATYFKRNTIEKYINEFKTKVALAIPADVKLNITF